MSTIYDAVVVGAGTNGLVTAAYLAKAGLRVLVVERRDVVGGLSVTEEFHPGFRVDPVLQGAGWLPPQLVADLELARHGVDLLSADPTIFAPLPDGESLTLWLDPRKTAEEIARFSQNDAAKWGAFCDRVHHVTTFLESVYMSTPPDVTTTNLSDAFSLAQLGMRLRRLGKEDMIELLRILPMCVSEFLDHWFESDALKGVLGAGGVTNLFQGPYAAGTAYLFLHHHVGSARGETRAPQSVRGGIGKLSRALADAAEQYGAEIRTGRTVTQVNVTQGQATSVTLENGETIAARCVVSDADPRRTFLGLVDPLQLDAKFVRKVQNVKFRGASARVHLALDGLPEFTSRPGDGAHLRGRISISPSIEYLERAYDDAKYGGISTAPYLSALIPSLTDPTLAPAGKHVMSVAVQYAPYHLDDGTWDDEHRDALGDVVVDTLAAYAPNLPDLVLHREVLSPPDLEQTYGVTEGNLYHGEMMLDQLFFMRPVPGWAQYRTPVERLYLCGAGTHPGGGVTGASGYNAAREIVADLKKR